MLTQQEPVQLALLMSKCTVNFMNSIGDSKSCIWVIEAAVLVTVGFSMKRCRWCTGCKCSKLGPETDLEGLKSTCWCLHSGLLTEVMQVLHRVELQ